jgi:hypothetical protein
MKIVDSIPGRQYYPWGEWFDGKVRLLEPGVDFTCEPVGMRSAAYSAAKKAGIKIVARVRPEGVYIHALSDAYTLKKADVEEEGQDGDDSRRHVA